MITDSAGPEHCYMDYLYSTVRTFNMDLDRMFYSERLLTHHTLKLT
jgi:hypothetical protein